MAGNKRNLLALIEIALRSIWDGAGERAWRCYGVSLARTKN